MDLRADLRTPQSQPTLVVVADAGDDWTMQLNGALASHGLEIDAAAPESAVWRAFEKGAAGLVLAPGQDSPETVWLAIVERAGRASPTTTVVLEQNRAGELAHWLATGFDDVVVRGDDPGLGAARLAARVRARAVRQSLTLVDSLTGLPSQQVFFSRLDPMVRLSSRAAMPLAVAVLDMDGFRAFEQRAGRPAVRAVLIDIAHHLQRALRRSDTVARLGDDRFGMILHHINGLEARRLLYKIWRSLSLEPATMEHLPPGAPLPTFTAGVSVFPDDANDGFELYTRAEIALDVARANGHRRVLLYSETSGDSGLDIRGSDLRLHRGERTSRSEPE